MSSTPSKTTPPGHDRWRRATTRLYKSVKNHLPNEREPTIEDIFDRIHRLGIASWNDPKMFKFVLPSVAPHLATGLYQTDFHLISVKCLRLGWCVASGRLDEIPLSERKFVREAFAEWPELTAFASPEMPASFSEPGIPAIIPVTHAWRSLTLAGAPGNILIQQSFTIAIPTLGSEDAPVNFRFKRGDGAGWLDARRVGGELYRPLLSLGTWEPISLSEFTYALARGEAWMDNPFGIAMAREAELAHPATNDASRRPETGVRFGAREISLAATPRTQKENNQQEEITKFIERQAVDIMNIENIIYFKLKNHGVKIQVDRIMDEYDNVYFAPRVSWFLDELDMSSSQQTIQGKIRTRKNYMKIDNLSLKELEDYPIKWKNNISSYKYMIFFVNIWIDILNSDNINRLPAQEDVVMGEIDSSDVEFVNFFFDVINSSIDAEDEKIANFIDQKRVLTTLRADVTDDGEENYVDFLMRAKEKMEELYENISKKEYKDLPRLTYRPRAIAAIRTLIHILTDRIEQTTDLDVDIVL